MNGSKLHWMSCSEASDGRRARSVWRAFLSLHRQLRSASIVADMQAFIERMASEPLDLKHLKIKGVSQNELLDLLSKVYLP